MDGLKVKTSEGAEASGREGYSYGFYYTPMIGPGGKNFQVDYSKNLRINNNEVK